MDSTSVPLNQLVRRWCQILVLFLVAQVTPAMAKDGLTVGAAAALPQHDVFAFNAHVALPVFGFIAGEQPLQFAARLDVSAPLDFSLPPALGLSSLIKSEDGLLSSYLGAGVGLSFITGHDSSAVLSSFVFTGVSIQFTDAWSTMLEGSVNLSSMGLHPNVVIGVTYTFGADQ